MPKLTFTFQRPSRFHGTRGVSRCRAHDLVRRPLATRSRLTRDDRSHVLWVQCRRPLSCKRSNRRKHREVEVKQLEDLHCFGAELFDLVVYGPHGARVLR